MSNFTEQQEQELAERLRGNVAKVNADLDLAKTLGLDVGMCFAVGGNCYRNIPSETPVIEVVSITKTKTL